MSRAVFRFAPSPNGPLHLGHAYSALLNAQMAKEADGRLLLRIEQLGVPLNDLDRASKQLGDDLDSAHQRPSMQQRRCK